MTAARIQEVMAVNVTGAILCTCTRGGETHVDQIRGQGRCHRQHLLGRGTASAPANTYVDYAASKAAIDALTVGLSHEVATDGIRVAGIRPA